MGTAAAAVVAAQAGQVQLTSSVSKRGFRGLGISSSVWAIPLASLDSTIRRSFKKSRRVRGEGSSNWLSKSAGFSGTKVSGRRWAVVAKPGWGIAAADMATNDEDMQPNCTFPTTSQLRHPGMHQRIGPIRRHPTPATIAACVILYLLSRYMQPEGLWQRHCFLHDPVWRELVELWQDRRPPAGLEPC